jgi:hypothetical protein
MKTLMTLAFSVALPVAAAAQNAAVFDWSVPERYSVDGMVGVHLPVTGTTATMRVLNPERGFGGAAAAGWPADFTACQSPGQIAKYLWSVDGRLVGESAACETRLVFPREGLYRVELTVVDGSGARSTASQDVNIQDWLIIGLGDSYGSGEGVPNSPAKLTNLGEFEAAHAAWRVASSNYQDAVAQVAAAQAQVDAARRDLDEAKRDLDEIAAAIIALANAHQVAADAQTALNAANAAVVRAAAATAAAVANVAVECAQFWAPERCTAAKANLARARQAEAAAIAARSKAVAKRDAAVEDLARKIAAVPVEGFEYVRGVAEARVALMQSRVNVATTAFNSAVQFAASSNEILEAAVMTMYQNAGETVALWQDSTPMAGRIILEEEPFYEPHMYSQCHQSKFSGQALAALNLEKSDSKTSVTFIHLACSGGTIPEGIVGDYGGIEAPRPGSGASMRRAQIDEAAQLAGGREVDAFVMSIGGNDIGFADTITNCITTEPCFAPTAQVMSALDIEQLCKSIVPGQGPLGAVAAGICQQSLENAAKRFVGSDAHTAFLAALEKLPGKYSQVETRLRQHWPTLPRERMFLTQYPMVTRDSRNEICGSYADPANNLPGISGPEQLWAEQVAGGMLNATIEDQEAALGWTVVKGIDEAFRLHGYCSENSWIVRIGESLAQQVGMSGTAHPNLNGHVAYSEKISASLKKAFYPQSVGQVLGPARVAGTR